MRNDAQLDVHGNPNQNQTHEEKQSIRLYTDFLFKLSQLILNNEDYREELVAINHNANQDRVYIQDRDRLPIYMGESIESDNIYYILDGIIERTEDMLPIDSRLTLKEVKNLTILFTTTLFNKIGNMHLFNELIKESEYNADILETLILAANDADFLNQQYRNELLLHSIRIDNLALARTILNHGANANTITRNSRKTMMMLAAEHAGAGMMYLLGEHGASLIDNMTRDKNTLHCAIKTHNTPVIDYLITQLPDCIDWTCGFDENTPLIASIIHNNEETFKKLVCYGANIYIENHKGETLEEFAGASDNPEYLRIVQKVQNFHIEAKNLIESNSSETLEKLLKNNELVIDSPINTECDNLLDFAVQHNLYEAIELLESFGLEVNNAVKEMTLNEVSEESRPRSVSVDSAFSWADGDDLSEREDITEEEIQDAQRARRDSNPITRVRADSESRLRECYTPPVDESDSESEDFTEVKQEVKTEISVQNKQKESSARSSSPLIFKSISRRIQHRDYVRQFNRCNSRGKLGMSFSRWG